MRVFLYLDESGSIHKNSSTKFFAVGGYFVLAEDRNKIISKYKKLNLKVKRERNINLATEIKSYDYKDEEKIEILNSIQCIPSFKGCAKVFDKTQMYKKIEDCNRFYNYAVSVLIQDCVFPFFENIVEKSDVIDFIISADSRNTSVGDLKDLEKYLSTCFVLKNCSFKVTYYDSASNYGVQLADLIVNTFYNKYKNIEIVKNVVSSLKEENFNASLFPKKVHLNDL